MDVRSESDFDTNKEQSGYALSCETVRMNADIYIMFTLRGLS